MVQLLIDLSRKKALIYASFLVLYEFLTYISNDMIMPGMLQVAASFHADESSVALSLTAYILGGSSLQLFLGPLSDRYGRRPVMLFGAVFFLLCSLIIAMTMSMNQFLVARFFQGMGLCFISVIGYTTLQEIFAEMDAIRLIAIMANVSITAPLLGPLLGAVVIYYCSWRFIFLVISLFAMLALWGLWCYMPESVGARRRDGSVILQTPLSIVTIMTNYKQLLFNRSVLLGSLAMGLMGLPLVAWIGLSPVMLVTREHLTLIQYGLWQLPVFGAFILGNVYLHRMTHHRTLWQLIKRGSLFTSIGFLLTYALPLITTHSFLGLMPGLTIYFFGAGMITMSIQGIGVELANVIYQTHHNGSFGLFCFGVGVIYALLMRLIVNDPNRSQ